MERDKLKKAIVMISLLAIVLMTMLFAGCETSAGKIEGIAYNNTEDEVTLKAHSSGHTDITRSIMGNSTNKFWLNTGTWEISVWYEDTGVKIDTETLIVQESDEWFDICIYDSSITVDAY